MARWFEQVARQVSIGESGQRTYVVFEATEDEAFALIDANADFEWQGLFRQKLSIESTGFEGIWTATVPYSKKKNEDDEEQQQEQQADPFDGLSFNVGTESQRITQPIKTRGLYTKLGKSIPNKKSAIGFDGENVEGVDILVPTFDFTIERVFQRSKITNSFVKSLVDCAGKVNRSKFKDKDQHCCQFMGCAGGKESEKTWKLQFNFRAAETIRNFDVGDIKVEEKRGFDYLWVRYKTDIDEEAVVKVPLGVYVEEIIEERDFSVLGLGN